MAQITEQSVVKLRLVGFGLFVGQLVYITFFMTSAYFEIENKIQACHQEQVQLSALYANISSEMENKREAIYYVNELKRRVGKLEAQCEK